MQRRIFLDEDDCSWQCDIETNTVIDNDSEIKGQPIPEHWKEEKHIKSNLMPNKPPQWDVIHGRMY
jgi:hypothetical protein